MSAFTTVLSHPLLNVDDSEAGRYARTRTLEAAGFQVVEAATGSDAMRLIEEVKPPLVLLDVRLPDMSGLDVCRYIKREYPSIMVLQISATYTGPDAKARGLEAGADSYLSEPVDPTELIANVQALLRLKHAEEELTKLNQTLERRVTERTEQLQAANSQLLQSQKLEALGQLTGGIAHDFNNLLSAILGNLRLLRKRFADEKDAMRLIDGAIEGASRGATLTQRLLVFARAKELQVQPVDVAALIYGMSDLLRRSIDASIRIAMDVPRNLPIALVDADQFELALLNLALNGRDAMPNGGVLTIAAREEHLFQEADGLPPGDYVRISVADTGTGMDEATLGRAIDPFFTTKGVGKGTGLGLSTVQGLALQSGGGLRLRSRLGQGTTAVLWLRRAEPGAVQAVEPRVEIPSALPPARSAKVLLVEDDFLIMLTTAEMLKDLGHDVVEARSGAEALKHLRDGTKFDIVVTDQGMPEMTGLQMAEKVRSEWPDLPILLVTGYAELPKDGISDLPRLSKPYQQEELGAAIARLVAARASAVN